MGEAGEGKDEGQKTWEVILEHGVFPRRNTGRMERTQQQNEGTGILKGSQAKK